jgi:CRP/FNR family transcriptional regulator, cyclic AMP receptor protein
MGKYINSLLESDLFYNLTSTQVELIEGLAEEQTYETGEIIFEENSHGNELYMILQGQVEIIVSAGIIKPEEGNVSPTPAVIANLWRGQSFGEVALVDEGIRTAGARAALPSTRLLRIPRKKFLMLCNTYPDLGYRVMFNLALDLAQKIRNADLKIRESLLYPSKPNNPS